MFKKKRSYFSFIDQQSSILSNDFFLMKCKTDVEKHCGKGSEQINFDCVGFFFWFFFYQINSKLENVKKQIKKNTTL